MATRFTFSEKQFNEIKQLMAAGPQHKSYREIGEMYDLGSSTLNRISRATDYRDYRRQSLIRSTNRRLQRQKVKDAKRASVAYLAAFAIVELVVIVLLLRR